MSVFIRWRKILQQKMMSQKITEVTITIKNFNKIT